MKKESVLGERTGRDRRGRIEGAKSAAAKTSESQLGRTKRRSVRAEYHEISAKPPPGEPKGEKERKAAPFRRRDRIRTHRA